MRRTVMLGMTLLLGGMPACTDGKDAADGDDGSGTGSSEGPDTDADGETTAADDETGDTGDAGTGGSDVWEEVRSDLVHDDAPTPSDTDRNALADGQLAFSLELFRNVRGSQTENFSVSGLSINLAFGMLYAGAVGNTRQEMVDHMYFLEGEEAQHVALNWQTDELVSRNLDPIEEEFNMFDPVIFTPANQMWVQTGQEGTVKAPFLDKLSVHYDAGLFLADFLTRAEEERTAINGWVADHTGGLIEELLPGGSITPGTTSVIVNALYLKAPWSAEFPMFATEMAPFTLPDNSTKSVFMMHNSVLQGMYAEEEGCRALGMPLRGNKLELVAILPDGDLDTFVDGLTAESFGALLDGMQWESVDTYLPRFETETKLMLKTPLMELGVTSMFSGGLDDIGGGVNFVDEVYHDTVVIVDEKGVEAAAATAIVTDTGGDGEPQPNAEFRADRPFLFVIYDRPTRSVLFLGQVTDP